MVGVTHASYLVFHHLMLMATDLLACGTIREKGEGPEVRDLNGGPFSVLVWGLIGGQPKGRERGVCREGRGKPYM